MSLHSICFVDFTSVNDKQIYYSMLSTIIQVINPKYVFAKVKESVMSLYYTDYEYFQGVSILVLFTDGFIDYLFVPCILCPNFQTKLRIDSHFKLAKVDAI